MGDQRRRSKSRGCQKEQVEGGERVGVCGQVYTEWVWSLFYSSFRGEEKRDKQGLRTEEVDGRWRRHTKEAEQRKKQKKQMTDEMSR